ncbi:LINE-1 retrotransposable element ORF1 protein [Labeo rohita]|uniref:LINE-1 retrotransposable element ORF1 protein n=1 Tax=Labeo rohita TaxID=84645 RepID=A0ABQ8L5B4_LABRO|nr:LINE-1 retrotransposable element ORF1 protein [Labeo rohita]
MSKGRGKQVDKDREGTLSPSASITLAEITALHDNLRASIAADFKASFENFAAKLDSIQSTRDNEWLNAKVSDLESRSRCQNIQILSLPESIKGPRPTAFFSQLLVDVLGSQVLTSPPELDRAHQSLAPEPAPGQRPHPVILRFHSFQIKDLVIRESRKKGELLYDGHKIRIFEDYCPEVLKLRAEYKDVMSSLYKRGLKPALLYPARLRITLPNGEKKWLASVSEANDFIQRSV